MRDANRTPGTQLPAELTGLRKFRVERELGRGGMGVVYKAHHLYMDRPVALKVINAALLDNPEALARFRAEVETASRLDHENIVRVYDAEQAGGLLLMVMEYVEGQSLERVLRHKGPLSVWEACRCVLLAAQGLQHAHEKGVIHRDLKPANLMLSACGEVKVLDFGLARLVEQRDRRTKLAGFMGTPQYASPEQALDARKADIRSDIYSLGCTLYSLLAGRPPFFENTEMDTLLAQVKKEPVRLPQAPPGLWQVIHRMLRKNPEDRYQAPIDVVGALRPFSDAPTERPYSSPPPLRKAEAQPARPSPGSEVATGRLAKEPRRRAARRRRWPVAVAAGVGLVGAALLGALLLALGPRKDEPPKRRVREKQAEVVRPIKQSPPPVSRKPIACSFSWRVEGEELVQEAAGVDSQVLFGDPGWTDYDYHVEAMKTGGVEGFVLSFRAHPGNQVPFTVPPAKIIPQKWHSLRVEVRGPEFRCFLDDHPLHSGRRPAAVGGAVGLETRSTAARFRNLRVVDPNGNVLWRGVPQIETAYYKIVSHQTRKLLDVPNASSANNVQIEQRRDHGGRQQHWQLVPVPGGFFRIVSRATGKALDVPRGLPHNGLRIEQFDNHGGPNQQWRFREEDGGGYTIVSRASGLALDVPNGTPDDGAKIIQWVYHAQSNQRWLLVRVKP